MADDELDPVMEAQIEAEVETAVAPYARLYPPPVLDELRSTLRLALRTDPYAQDLLSALRPRVVPEESNKVHLRSIVSPEKKDGTGRS